MKKGALHIIEAILSTIILLSIAIYISKSSSIFTLYTPKNVCLNDQGNIFIERHELKSTGWINKTLNYVKECWMLYDGKTIRVYNSTSFSQDFILTSLNVTVISFTSNFSLYYNCLDMCIVFLECYQIQEGEGSLNFLNQSFGVNSYES